MTRFEIQVEPYGSLFVGGYAQALGGSDGDTASDPLGFLLPGSAVKGALRESATRLVHGLGRGEELLRRLFGAAKDDPGLIRVGTLRPNEAVGAGDGTIRNHVSLERATRQAAPQRLFQNRVTPALPELCFRGVVESREPLNEDELGLLRSAVRITDQIGGGRGRGLGLVSVSLVEVAAETTTPCWEVGEESTSLVLGLEAEEPLHLSGVKDPTNYVTSKDYLDGCTLRGAVAAALGGRPEDPEMEQLLGGDSAAVFSDGHTGGPRSIPAPMTLQEPKRGGPLLDIAAVLCAEACGSRPGVRPEDVRTAKGTVAWSETGWFSITVKRRTITRTARDCASGRSADGRLFSLEVLDPENLRFYVPVSGSREQLALTLQAAARGLLIGGDRSRGYGRLRLVDVQTESPLPALEERHRSWSELVERLGVPVPESTGVLLAVGPLAVTHERFVSALEKIGLELKEGVARRHAHGGWNARIHLPRSLSSHYLPGSTFIVQTDGSSALPVLAELEKKGLGPGRPDGWGRLIACHPIHVDCFKEESECPR